MTWDFITPCRERLESAMCMTECQYEFQPRYFISSFLDGVVNAVNSVRQMADFYFPELDSETVTTRT
jgi:hypothetical protein